MAALPQHYLEPERSVAVAHRADLCVVGGSCTGVFAAVRAARRGLNVALIEQQSILGGSAVAAQVNEWHSLRDAREQRQIVGGLTAEALSRLRARGSVLDIPAPSRGRHRFNSAELAVVLDDLVSEHRIRVFLCARVVSAVREGDSLRAAIIEDRSGRRAVAARFFVDASGDGDLLRRAGFGAWRAPVLQPVNLQALVAGLDRWRGARSHGEFWKAAAPLARGHGLPEANAQPWFFDYPGADRVTNIFGPRQHGIDASDADQFTAALVQGRRYQRAYLELAHELHPEDRPRLVAHAHTLGVRETWHVASLGRLSGEALLAGELPADHIALGTYPVDVHHAGGTVLRYLDGTEENVDRAGVHTRGRWRPEDSATPACYGIPFSALIPATADNLLVAGRLIDADRAAFGAVRVMVNCNQMGEAVGEAAALALGQDVAPSALDPAGLRDALVAGGSLLDAAAIA